MKRKVILNVEAYQTTKYVNFLKSQIKFLVHRMVKSLALTSVSIIVLRKLCT